MKYRQLGTGRLIHSILIVTLVLVAIALATHLAAPDAQLKNDGLFLPVRLTGEYRMDGGPWLPLQEGTQYPLDRHHVFEMKGHFTVPIEKNHQLILRISDLVVRMEVDGVLLFAFGDSPQHSPGNVWQSVTSPGITTQDPVKITLQNAYTGVHPQSVNQFLEQMRFGSMDGLYQMTFRQNGGSTLVGLFIIAVGLAELVAAIVMCLLRQEGTARTFYSAGFAACSGVWFLIQYNIISLLFRYPAVVGAADVLSAYLMSVFFALYVATYLTGREHFLCRCNTLGALAMALFPLALMAAGRADAYVTISLGWPVTVANLLLCILYLVLEYRKQKSREIKIFTISLSPLFLGSLLDALGYWTGLSNETKWLRSCFLLFVLIQFVILILQLRDNANRAARTQKLENELVQSRITVMLSQIQPHFLYNSLLAIQQLCDENPRQAERAVEDFSWYLRGNLDALSTTRLITFRQELEHVEHYLALEKMRFGDRLAIEYDIQAEDFRLPALTIQPVVENAVRHGVTRKLEGGTVRISSRETPDAVCVTVSDDGVGFQAHPQGDAGRDRVGLENVRRRLDAMCGGSLQIESSPRVGTTVTILIPGRGAASCV